MSKFKLSPHTKPLLLLTLSLLGACTSADQIVKSSVESVTNHYGADSFNLIATAPANFGLTSKSQYSPQAGQQCKTYLAGLGGEVTSQHQKTDSIDVKSIEQTAKFNIPLNYHVAGCTMELTRVDVAIDGHYGTSPLDIGGDVGGISVIADTLTGGLTSSSSASSEFRGLCTWMFQLSVARIQQDGISKILSCNAADSDWSVSSDYFERNKPGGTIPRSSLKNKDVKFTFRLSKDEEPSMDNRWIKTDKGWKPCQGSATSNRCQTPPVFKKFKMNGRECTVYPTCTE
ncbi:hypothetical protein [Pseudomonas botevensis]|uniref:hypothetical protein n=1 Tax=Pseudomonas botevensis TaxID=2842352 RepID=UPI001C3C3543|nr:hypothetical protein [Pseudomonas botevensis]MBV4475958.1 hypothetical protein [Pseudomonas botevensis]